MGSHRNVLAARLARSAISLERMSLNYHGPGPQWVHMATDPHGHELEPSRRR